MKISIPLLNTKFSDCFESVLANIAHWQERDYQLMYVNEWDFKFTSQNSLGNSLDTHRDKSNAFNSYYGIKYTEYDCPDFKELIAVLNEELKDKPITVRVDTYYCPWDKGYMKYHNKMHIYFVNGLDREQSFLYCTDPFYHIEDRMISYDSFVKGYTGRYGSFEIGSDKSRDVDGREILIKILTSTIENNIFDSIRHFAQMLDKTESLANELEGFNAAWQTPLYWNIVAIEKSRKRIPFLFLFIADQYNVTEVIDYLDEINLINEKWDGLAGLILKMLMTKDFSLIKDRIVDKLYEISEYEKSVANQLLDVLLANKNRVCEIK